MRIGIVPCRQRREFFDIRRGMNLLQTQANVKKCVYNASSDRAANITRSFISMANAMLEILGENEMLLSEDDEANAAAEDTVTSENRVKILHEVKNCVHDLQAVFGSSGWITTSCFPGDGDSCRSTQKLSDYVVTCNGRDVNNPLIDSPDNIVFTHAKSNDGNSYLEVKFPKREELATITVQGGFTVKPHLLHDFHDEDTEQGELGSPPESDTPTFSALPCGLGVSDCDGSIEKTVLALADVISWEKITKKNSPETVVNFVCPEDVEADFLRFSYCTRVAQCCCF